MTRKINFDIKADLFDDSQKADAAGETGNNSSSHKDTAEGGEDEDTEEGHRGGRMNTGDDTVEDDEERKVDDTPSGHTQRQNWETFEEEQDEADVSHGETAGKTNVSTDQTLGSGNDEPESEDHDSGTDNEETGITNHEVKANDDITPQPGDSSLQREMNAAGEEKELNTGDINENDFSDQSKNASKQELKEDKNVKANIGDGQTTDIRPTENGPTPQEATLVDAGNDGEVTAAEDQDRPTDGAATDRAIPATDDG